MTVQRELTQHGIAQSLPSLFLSLDLSKPVPAAVGAASSVTGSTAGNDPESRLSATAVELVGETAAPEAAAAGFDRSKLRSSIRRD